MRQVSRKRKAFTLIELLVVVAIIALLISILLPSLARARELAKRGVCSANLKGIGTSLATYGNENGDIYPIATQNSTLSAQITDTTTGVTYTGAIGAFRGQYSNPAWGNPDGTNNSWSQLSVARNLWTLVRLGMAPVKSFICPSTDDQPNSDDAPQNYWDFGKRVGTDTAAGDWISTMTAGHERNGYEQVSYSYQVPYGKRGKPTGDRGADIAIAADRGPWQAYIDGQKTSPDVMASPDANSGQIAFTSITSTSTPDQVRRYNSPNHGGVGEGEGQVVLYGDSHAEFMNKSTCGHAYDNIYTAWTATTSATNITQRLQGEKPTDGGKIAPRSDDDSFLY